MKSLLLCIAVTLFKVNHCCNTGKEFITAFLPNYVPSGVGQKLQLALTAYDSPAQIRIQIHSLRFSMDVQLGRKESRWVSLPGGAEFIKPGTNSGGVVHVTSSATISMLTFNFRLRTGDASVVAPVDQLGTEYFVYTPNTFQDPFDKEFAIANGDKANQVTFLPASNVVLIGMANWNARKKVTVSLEPFEVYLVRSRETLTGTQVVAQRPVAVVAGHQCLRLGITCNHVYEQLPPLSSLSTHYLVPSMHTHYSIDMAIIVATEDNTVVQVFSGGGPSLIKLNAGNTLDKIVPLGNPLVLKSDKKVMVMYHSNNYPHDPFLMSIVPTAQLATDWSVDTPGMFKSTAVVLSEREGMGSVKVCVRNRCGTPNWKDFHSDQKYVWTRFELGQQMEHVTMVGDALMAVYVYGEQPHDGYGTTGVCSKAIEPVLPTDPCENVKCKQTEACVNGACVYTSTATCRAMGDPHYRTFDGRRFDFQGTCTYTMTSYTKTLPGLYPFTVTTKNNHRGSKYVAFVRTVNVNVFNQSVVISSRRGQVEVNGELVFLPVTVLAGRLVVKQSGSYAVLSTAFGLTVKYDWDSRLYITAPSSYSGHLGGLCGNYNGNPNDEFTDRSGTSMSSVLLFAQSWKAPDSDRFCNDNCAGTCPTCSAEQQTFYQGWKFCGLMAKPDGPFASCHKVIEPRMYVDNCAFDICINNGVRRFLCDNFKSYVDACMAEGVKLNPEWRTTSNCPLACPAGSHYEACGSACPASCGDLEAPAHCSSACVEACQCDKGTALSGDRCVPIQSCGCQYQGRYYPTGSHFWADQGCTSRCSCVLGKSQVECKPASCKTSEQCGMKDGIRDCYPASYSTCQGSGDPHYRSFDGKLFDFQGTCTYVLSKLAVTTDPTLVPFQVLVQNENRGRNKAVAYTKTVSITIYNYTLTMSKERPGKLLVNGQYVNLPFSVMGGQLSVFRQGYFGVVNTVSGVSLSFNWNSHVTLTLPSSYAAQVAGLCGNYNGQNSDDLQLPDHTPAKNPSAFGDSWKVGGNTGCSSDCPGGKCPKCSPALELSYKGRQYCGLMADKAGPFRQCHVKVSPDTFVEDCVFDLCAYDGHSSALCNSLTTYATACQNADAVVDQWRFAQLCSPTCPANSHYEVCAKPCPQTCQGLTGAQVCQHEGMPCTEACVCNDGFLLSSDVCVPLAECGCTYQNQYYQNGQVFFPSGGCNPRCVCSNDGQVTCDAKFACSANEKCSLQDGVQACVPTSIGRCSVGGAREVLSFDGRTFTLWGDCVYKLAETSLPEEFIDAWAIKQEGVTCKTGCGKSPCPKPDKNKLPEANKACSIIKANPGPFVGCHGVVAPSQYYDACVKEVATFGGGDKILCRHIQDYVFACQSAGGTATSWRSETFCSITCPPKTHYELCADTCSSSCSAVEEAVRCPACTEGCQCDPGLLFDGLQCVPMGACGCVLEGRYFKSGESVTLDDCSQTCSCQSGQLSCIASQCQKGQDCVVKAGVLGCYAKDLCEQTACRQKERCVLKDGQPVCEALSKATCWAVGDPHYSTFDSYKYSFQGTCSYILLNTTSHDPTLPKITVISKNERWHQSPGSYVRSTTVDLLGIRIAVLGGQRGTVEVDGVKNTLPLFIPHGSINITVSGIRGVLRSDIGVEITFDWATLFMVSVSSSFYGSLSGLCGNYNGEEGDELTTRSGTLTTNNTAFAASWSVADGDQSCYHSCVGQSCPSCLDADRELYSGPGFCGALAGASGPFSQCHRKVPVAEFVSNCLYDVCVNKGRQEILCKAFESYVTACQDAGATIPPQWRQQTNCGL
ncbi:IgGFc-binding protein-like [Aplochiton taeniatus]